MFPAHSAPATLARISQVYDPLNKLILDALIAPYHRDERDLLVEHLCALEAGCLLLLDMGYPAFRVFAALQTRKIAWCARVALDTGSVVRDFLAAGRVRRRGHAGNPTPRLWRTAGPTVCPRPRSGCA